MSPIAERLGWALADLCAAIGLFWIAKFVHARLSVLDYRNKPKETADD